MNNRIVRLGVAAVAVAVLAFIGINLLTGRDSGAQTGARVTPPVASATAGGLDTSFGGDGKVVTNLTRGHGMIGLLLWRSRPTARSSSPEGHATASPASTATAPLTRASASTAR